MPMCEYEIIQIFRKSIPNQDSVKSSELDVEASEMYRNCTGGGLRSSEQMKRVNTTPQSGMFGLIYGAEDKFTFERGVPIK